MDQINPKTSDKVKLLIGMEPTGPYLFNLARDLQRNGIAIITVNPKMQDTLNLIY